MAQRPIADMDAYRDHPQTFVYARHDHEAHLHGGETGSKARGYSEGEEERVPAQRMWSMKKSPAPPSSGARP